MGELGWRAAAVSALLMVGCNAGPDASSAPAPPAPAVPLEPSLALPSAFQTLIVGGDGDQRISALEGSASGEAAVLDGTGTLRRFRADGQQADSVRVPGMPHAIAAGPDGHWFVRGQFSGTQNFGQGPVTATGMDAFIVDVHSPPAGDAVTPASIRPSEPERDRSAPRPRSRERAHVRETRAGLASTRAGPLSDSRARSSPQPAPGPAERRANGRRPRMP